MMSTTTEGQRVRLLSTPDGWTRCKAGDEGTVRLVDRRGTVFVTWDNGANQTLLPGRDHWETMI